MTGIVSTLETDNHIGPLRQPIDDLTFALVPPLGTYYGDIGHLNPPRPP